MADISDVEQQLAAFIAGVIYPNGTGQPSAVTAGVRIYRGWPPTNALQADLLAGMANISVFAQSGVERNVTRFPKDWKTIVPAAPTMTATVVNNQITLGGTPSVPQYVTVLALNQIWSYAVQTGQTLSQVATGLAALINAFVSTSSTGPVITVSTGATIVARVGSTGTAVLEVKRQQRGVMISVWSPTPNLRDAIASLIDAQLANLNWLSLPDGTNGRLIYQRSWSEDVAEKSGLFRRDFVYWVEYPTILTEQQPDVTAPFANVIGSQFPIT